MATRNANHRRGRNRTRLDYPRLAKGYNYDNRCILHPDIKVFATRFMSALSALRANYYCVWGQETTCYVSICGPSQNRAIGTGRARYEHTAQTRLGIRMYSKRDATNG